MADWIGKAEDRAWVEAGAAALELAVGHFLDQGDWPAIEIIQRALDRARVDLDVLAWAQLRPRDPGSLPLTLATRLVPTLRQLYWVPAAADLVATCWLAISRAADIYFVGEESAQLTNRDATLLESVPGALGPMVTKIAPLLMADHPSPFAGGAYGQDWTLNINTGVARRLRDCGSIEHYFAVQSVLLDEYAKAQSSQAPIFLRGVHESTVYNGPVFNGDMRNAQFAWNNQHVDQAASGEDRQA